MSVTGISDNASFDLSAYPRSRARIADNVATSAAKQPSRPEPRPAAATEIINSAHEGLLSKIEEAGIGARATPSTSVAAALEAFSSF
jgi:hypothetical protein